MSRTTSTSAPLKVSFRGLIGTGSSPGCTPTLGDYYGCLKAETSRLLSSCLGWVAERWPGLIREIRDAGHELASHGYDHKRVTTLTPEEFREDIRRSKAMIEDIAGEPVLGYRAPSYSIVRENLWALDILSEEGFAYDSSIFPIRHDRYGIPDSPRFPWQRQEVAGAALYEFPSFYCPSPWDEPSLCRGRLSEAVSILLCAVGDASSQRKRKAPSCRLHPSLGDRS